MVISSWKVRAGILAALLLASVGIPVAVAEPGGGGSPPVIMSIGAVQVPGQKFRISGMVADANPANCGVVITGAANGVAMCDSTGKFDAIFDVPTPGGITAVAGDGQLSSQPVSLTLTNAAPTITIVATQIGASLWRFSGVVGDEAPAGLTVTLTGGGVAGRTATVLANGSWSTTVNSSIHGTATATVTDWYGLTGSASTSY